MDSIYSPWFLLLPLDSQRVKRFMPAGLFVAVLYTVIFQIAEVWNWWDVHEENNIFFLTNISSFVYGFLIVITIYMFYFTYSNFWLFLIANWIIDFHSSSYYKSFYLSEGWAVYDEQYVKFRTLYYDCYYRTYHLLISKMARFRA